MNRFRFLFEITNKIVICVSNFEFGILMIMWGVMMSVGSIVEKCGDMRKGMKGDKYKIVVKKNGVLEEIVCREVLPGMICRVRPKDIITCDFLVVQGGCVCR